MSNYIAPIRDSLFILQEVLKVSEMDVPGYGDLDKDFTEAVLNEAGKLASEVYAPLNRDGDSIGCSLNDGNVSTPPGFKEAYNQLRDGGWPTLDAPEEFGGQGLPYLLNAVVNEILSSANVSLAIYQILTHGAASAILAHGSDELKSTFLPKLFSAEWGGTMNLTEPHCGTDLGLMRTKAEPQEDGTFRISGQKIFISAGDHDLSENIVHLVLARIPNGPKGVKGISLFVVPKYLVNEDGSLGARNDVSVGSIEEKMGIHGNATCVLNYEGATGYLLGQEHKGMRAMFTMMNEARLSTAMQGVSLAEAAYQKARDYALDRLQGRAFTGAVNPNKPADPLIVHPDIRRNLLEQKSFVEGGRAFAYWGALLIDQAHRSEDADADAMISLLIPVMKGFLTDKGLEATIQAQQVFGGHGYIEEHGMSQFVRDVRIAQIYEGANGIHAMDLVTRRMPANGGQTFKAFFQQVGELVSKHIDNPQIGALHIAPLSAALKDLQEGVSFLTDARDNPNVALAGSYDFMHLFGYVCLGYMWAQQAVVANSALLDGRGDAAFYETKLKTSRFYMARQLPLTSSFLARIKSGADPVMEMESEEF